MIGQLLTLPRWIQIVLARIKGLGVVQEAGKKPLMFRSNKSLKCIYLKHLLYLSIYLNCNCVCLENTEKEEKTFFEDTQTDFRSILSYGVQSP